MDTLYIKWFDWWGNHQELFSLRYADTTKHKNIYRVDGLSGILKIPKTELKEKKLSLYTFMGYRKILDFEVPYDIDEVNILANDKITMHTYDKTNEKLFKKKDGFTTVGMWTKGRRTLFLKRDE